MQKRNKLGQFGEGATKLLPKYHEQIKKFLVETNLKPSVIAKLMANEIDCSYLYLYGRILRYRRVLEKNGITRGGVRSVDTR